MKLKYYLRGLGIGILVATVILIISFSGHKADLSDEEIIARAQALGMVMTEQKKTDVIPKGTENLDTEGTEKIPKAVEPVATEQTEGASQVATQAQTETSTKVSAPEQTQPASETGDTSQLAITIEPGDSSNTVADKLFVAALVDDAAAFNKYLVDNKYDSSIQPGTFTIPKGTTYEEISKLLTGVK